MPIGGKERLAVAALALSAMLGAGVAPTFATSGPLDAADIKSIVGGKRIYLATPFGGEFPLNYRSGGVVDGDGEALGLGKMMAPTDKGRWWIDGNRLCQQWQEWYDGRAHCFTLTRTGDKSLRWLRDDGLAGTARIE
ncbi:hypothetical protein RUR49_19225 [Pseudoxanthobacter sp. M-2]